MGNKFVDTLCIRVISADIPSALQALTKANINISSAVWESDLSITLFLKRREFLTAKMILENRGDKCEQLTRWGITRVIYQLRQRIFLILAVCFLFALTLWIPTRIFFIQVQGNHYISEGVILQVAGKLGIEFGCNRAEIRSENTKNLMLEEIPELEWVGITTNGCVATINVQETIHSRKDNLLQGSVIANLDGIVTSVTTTKGKALCKPGDVVKLGQVLISGYEDCGLKIRYTGADGEVIAKTYRTIDVKTPLVATGRKHFIQEENKYALKIGKKLIKFSKDSGISPPGCVKMYAESYLSLPGGFQLPISFIHEQILYYGTDILELPGESFDWLENLSDSYLREQMISGTILDKKTELYYTGDYVVLHGTYYCTEQIGKYKREEFPNYGKNG